MHIHWDLQSLLEICVGRRGHIRNENPSFGYEPDSCVGIWNRASDANSERSLFWFLLHLSSADSEVSLLHLDCDYMWLLSNRCFGNAQWRNRQGPCGDFFCLARAAHGALMDVNAQGIEWLSVMPFSNQQPACFSTMTEIWTWCKLQMWTACQHLRIC